MTDAKSLPTPSQFAELMFGWKAFDYQVKPLDDLSQRVIMACGRQIGKTEMAAIKGLYYAIMYPASVILIISPTQRQSGILFRRMKRFINSNSTRVKCGECDQQILIDDIISRETQTVIEFNNGSEIHSLPAVEDGSNIRGFVSNYTIIDEGGLINDLVYAAVMPMLATTQGKLLLTGTPKGVGNFFYKAFTEKNLGFVSYHIVSKQNPKITNDFLKQQAETLSDVEYREEYLGEFLETVGVMFPIKTVESCMKKDWPHRASPLPIYEYYLGFDPARFGEDDAVGIVLEKRPTFHKDFVVKEPYAVVNFIELRGKSLANQVELIKNLHKTWNFETMVIDSTAIGTGVTEPLINERLPVEEFQFTIKTKQDLYFNLLRIMESGQIILPANQKMKKQFVELRQEKQEGTGLTKIYHPRKGHDDFVTSCALAVWGASSRKKQPILFARPGHGFF